MHAQLKKKTWNQFNLLALGALFFGQSSQAIIIEHGALVQQFQDQNQRSAATAVQRNFNLRMQTAQQPIHLFGQVIQAPSISTTVSVQASGNRCTQVGVTQATLNSNRLSFNLTLSSECSGMNTTVTGNLSETLCVPCVQNLPIAIEIGDLISLQVKRGETTDLIAKFQPSFLSESVLPLVREAVSNAFQDLPRTNGVGLSMSTHYARLFNDETKNTFTREMSCMAHDKQQMVNQSVELIATALSQTFIVNAQGQDVSALTEFSEAAFVKTSAEENLWSLQIF